MRGKSKASSCKAAVKQIFFRDWRVCEYGDGFPGSVIPEADGAVLCLCCEKRAIRRKGQIYDGCGVAFKARDLVRLNVP
jgi:hypothetical protein